MYHVPFNRYNILKPHHDFWNILYMDTDSEKDISIDDESNNLSFRQEPSCNSDDSRNGKEDESVSGIWQTRSNRNMYTALSFTDSPPEVATLNTACNSNC
jgi:hypothetical protein